MRSKYLHLMLLCSLLMAGLDVEVLAQSAPHGHAEAFDTTSIAEAIGTSGQWSAAEGVYKVSYPRKDVKVKVDGVALPPFMGLTSWVGFQQHGIKAMIMGDLVLFQDEVNPVMNVLLDNGVTVTGLHNHFFYSEPSVYFMHVGGDGNPEALARTIKMAMDTVKAIRAAHAEPLSSFGGPTDIDSSSLSSAPLNNILKLTGTEQNGMVKYTVGRMVRMPDGMAAGKEMGINTWAALMGKPDHAVIDGDFATAEGELQPVLKALRHADINIVAIHSHMEGDSPHLIFLHYWGVGPAEQLTRGFRSALDAQAAVSKPAAVTK